MGLIMKIQHVYIHMTLKAFMDLKAYDLYEGTPWKSNLRQILHHEYTVAAVLSVSFKFSL